MEQVTCTAMPMNTRTNTRTIREEKTRSFLLLIHMFCWLKDSVVVATLLFNISEGPQNRYFRTNTAQLSGHLSVEWKYSRLWGEKTKIEHLQAIDTFIHFPSQLIASYSIRLVPQAWQIVSLFSVRQKFE